MQTLTLNYDKAHDFVSNNIHRGYFWDGWNINRWVPNPSGYMSPNGEFRNGKWGMKFIFPLNNDGSWNIKVPDNVQYN